MKWAVCNVQCALCTLHYPVCSAQCAVCYVQCAVCNVQCIVCYVQVKHEMYVVFYILQQMHFVMCSFPVGL